MQLSCLVMYQPDICMQHSWLYMLMSLHDNNGHLLLSVVVNPQLWRPANLALGASHDAPSLTLLESQGFKDVPNIFDMLTPSSCQQLEGKVEGRPRKSTAICHAWPP